MRYPREFTEHLARHTDTSDPDACWIWGSRIGHDGYGRVSMTREMAGRMAHRVSYEHFVGPIPDGLQIDHLCRTRACVNPRHLEAVTQSVNLRRRPRVTHCKHGHELNDENAYMQGGRRQCRPCNRRRVAEYTRRKTA